MRYKIIDWTNINNNPILTTNDKFIVGDSGVNKIKIVVSDEMNDYNVIMLLRKSLETRPTAYQGVIRDGNIEFLIEDADIERDRYDIYLRIYKDNVSYASAGVTYINDEGRRFFNVTVNKYLAGDAQAIIKELTKTMELAKKDNSDLSEVIKKAEEIKNNLDNSINSGNSTDEKLKTSTEQAESKNEELNLTIANSERVKSEIIEKTDNAILVKTSLMEKIEIAENTIIELDERISESKLLKTSLENLLREAGEVKTSLEENIRTAKEENLKLSQLNSLASETINNLQEKISLADEKIVELDDEGRHQIDQVNQAGELKKNEIKEFVKVNKENLIGPSVFDEWKVKNPDGTWEEFLTTLKGPGIQSLQFKEELENGTRVYDIILEGGIKSGTISISAGKNGVGITNKEFVREDEQGNYVYRDVYSDGSKSSEYISPRGPRGYTGGTANGEQAPSSVPYGTIVEWSGTDIPNGWAYTNGGTLLKSSYPHMSDVLSGVTQPVQPYFKISKELTSISGVEIDGINKDKYKYPPNPMKNVYLYDDTGAIYDTRNKFRDILINKGGLQSVYYNGMTQGYYYIEIPEELSISYLSINRLNAEGKDAYSPSSKTTDIYIVIEYFKDDSWFKGAELHNKTDFIPPSEESRLSVAMVKSSFKSTKFRMYIDTNKSQAFYSNNVYFVGEVSLGFDKGGAQFTDFLQLPNEEDSKGRYKIIYIGQPLDNSPEPAMYAYDKNYNQTKDVPFSLAAKDEIPAYAEGITMSEPLVQKIGYTNKYDRETDTWKLEKTHLNKEGYNYNSITGDIKYSFKPTEFHVWDFDDERWIITQEGKEKALKSLLNILALKRMEKRIMLELQISTSEIEKEIEQLKIEIKKLKEEI